MTSDSLAKGEALISSTLATACGPERVLRTVGVPAKIGPVGPPTESKSPGRRLPAAITQRDQRGPRIRYMGTKQAIAAEVAALARGLPEGLLVDLFGGMCSVAGAIAPDRNAYANDIQSYAALAARCVLTSRAGSPGRSLGERKLSPLYRENRAALVDRFAREIANERRVLVRAAVGDYGRAASEWKHVGNDAKTAAEAAELRQAPSSFPYRLASITFAWGYFGLMQAIELDSIRYAVDEGRRQRLVTAEQARWATLALLQTASRIATTPGHFAQFLHGESPAGLQRIVASRRRSAWDAFLDDLDSLRPFGTAQWRAGNKVFQCDALDIWATLDKLAVGPAVYYADPPYSKEHYSRFYHVLETLTLYDYPEAEGAGRYRRDRFQTPFSLKTKVASALNTICENIARRKSTLILSYPSSGLLTAGLGCDVATFLSEHFRRVTLAFEADAQHSTLGARHGSRQQQVTEFVWVAH